MLGCKSVPKVVEESEANHPLSHLATNLCHYLTALVSYWKVLLAKINSHFQEENSLSLLQNGFCSGKSTLDAIWVVMFKADNTARGPTKDIYAVVSIDVQNAFNSTP